jgi:serine/threonine protein phosphatase 1
LAIEGLRLKFGLSRIGEAGASLARGLAVAFGSAGGLARALRSRPEPVGLTKASSAPVGPARVPAGRRIYAVGDIHGRADLLKRLINDLEQDIARGGFEGRPILIFLGDYIDRGFQSKDVISILSGESLSRFETYFLKGNHEAAMLQFLTDPSIGPRWAEYGGVETLVSYGVQPPRTRTNLDDWARASDDLKERLPVEHRQFLGNLDLSVRIGDYVFVHAGIRPGMPLDQQTEHDLLWIREDFLDDRHYLGAVVVHGHTPSSRPYRDSRRIGIDTGAYLSGRLTAARFEHESVEFIMTGPLIEAASQAG